MQFQAKMYIKNELTQKPRRLCVSVFQFGFDLDHILYKFPDISNLQISQREKIKITLSLSVFRV